MNPQLCGKNIRGIMSKLEELIRQYCPDGVEWKKLRDILKIRNGRDYKHLGAGSVPVYGSGGIMTYVDASMYNKPSVLIPRKGSIDKIYYVDTPFWNVDTVFYTEINTLLVNEKYVFYALQKEHLEKLNTAGGVPSLTQTVLNDVKIPVPPLPVQEEIVRILDTFTELQAELQAELQKRKLQYNYYLDNLLNFNRWGGCRTEVRWMKLKDVATQWYRGAGIKREEVSEDGMPCIRYGEIHTTYNIWFEECISHTDESKQVSRKYADKGDILFAITSEDIPFIGNSVAYLGDERILVGGDIVVMKHNQDPKYIAYALSTSDAIRQKGKGKVKSKVVHTNVPSLQEIVIPIPSLTEQKRIAGILDRFDRLTNDLSCGLPAEMEKRRQQYEYYRDKLLSFKRMSD